MKLLFILKKSPTPKVYAIHQGEDFRVIHMRRQKFVESGAPGRRHHSERVRHAELRIEQRTHVTLLKLPHRAVRAVHDHALDIIAADFVLVYQIEQRLDRTVQAAATRERFLASLEDTKLAAERGDRRIGFRDGTRICFVESAPVRLEDEARTDESRLGEQRRTHAVLGRASGVEALRHGAIDEKCPRAARIRAGKSQCRRKARRIETQNTRGPRSGTKRSARAGRVPAQIVVRPITAGDVPPEITIFFLYKIALVIN